MNPLVAKAANALTAQGDFYTSALGDQEQELQQLRAQLQAAGTQLAAIVKRDAARAALISNLGGRLNDPPDMNTDLRDEVVQFLERWHRTNE